MSVTVVHDYYFMPDGDVAEGKAAAAEFAAFLNDFPGNQVSLWLEDRENPLHHFHINVFDSVEDFEKVLETPEVQHFSDRLYPHVARSTHVAPLCDVWLAQGKGIETTDFS